MQQRNRITTCTDKPEPHTSELGTAGVADRHRLTGGKGGSVLGLGLSNPIGPVGGLSPRVLGMLGGPCAETLLGLIVTALRSQEQGDELFPHREQGSVKLSLNDRDYS